MLDVLTPLLEWYERDEPVGLATVVRTFRSAPREPGAAMVVRGDEVLGSVSGGCVEAAVYDAAQVVVADGAPRLEAYGVSDDDAAAVGLTCGGEIHVFIEPVTRATFPELAAVAASIRTGEAVALVTVVSGPGVGRGHLAVWPDRTLGTLGGRRLDDAVTDDVRGMLEQGQTGELRYGPDGERRLDDQAVFVQSFAPPPQLFVFGAIDFAAAVAQVGKFLGYRVTVCDARPVFATARRFPEADEVVVDWPHRYLAGRHVDARAVICVLTHDPKFDVPLLEVALRTPAAYIGAMGSRRTHAERLAQLRAAGVPEAQLSRISSPIGLDIGARTPAETAVSIAAELVMLRWGGSGSRLSDTTGRIHHAGPADLGRGDEGGHQVRCAGLVLAAGGGTRLGRPKALVEVGGQRLVDRSVATLVAGGAAPVVVVGGAVSVGELSAGQRNAPVGTLLVENPDWQTGMAGSLRAGLEALRAYPDVHAVAVTLVDLPGVTPDAVRAVVAATATGARIAVATYGGVRGHPVVLRREDWTEVAELASGDAGARRFLARHASDVVAVECGDTRALLDIDTEEDLAAARREEWPPTDAAVSEKRGSPEPP